VDNKSESVAFFHAAEHQHKAVDSPDVDSKFWRLSSSVVVLLSLKPPMQRHYQRGRGSALLFLPQPLRLNAQ